MPQSLRSRRQVCHYTRTLRYTGNPHVMLLIFVVGINFCRKAVQEFIFEEEGFYEISENTFPSKITRYTVYHV